MCGSESEKSVKRETGYLRDSREIVGLCFKDLNSIKIGKERES